MSTKSTITRTLAVLAGASLALTACGGGTESPQAAQEGSTVTYWSMWKEGEPQQKVMASAIAAKPDLSTGHTPLPGHH